MLGEINREEGIRYFQRGLLLERANRLSEAADAYRAAIDYYPQLREAHAALGFYYQRTGLLAKAADKFKTVVALEGDFLSYFNLGYVLVELGCYEEALHAFQHCLAYDPEDPATHYEVSYIHYTRGDFLAALHHLERPLHSYPEDWEVHNLIGKCHLGLRNYDSAVSAFGQGLMQAHLLTAQAELLDNIASVERHREFRSLHSDKDQMYADDGVVYIGSAQDNGLRICEVEDYHFTYPDIGITLQRLMALQQGSHWQFTALVAVDKLSMPLTIALSELTGTPARDIDSLVPQDHALLITAIGREIELMQLAIERAPCPVVTFCLGVNWLRHSKVMPDIIGIAARGVCSVPWEAELRRLRADGAAATWVQQRIDDASNQILQAVQTTPPDHNLPRQVRYYTRTHRRLSFLMI